VNLLLLGPQGAGKGTQARRIAETFGIPHISTGDMLRDAIEARTPLGERVRPIVERGGLVPDDLMIELIRERIDQPDADQGFVLDGFPRTLAQAEALDRMLEDIGKELSLVFVLQLDDDEAFQRLLRRAQLEGRMDDTPEGIRERLRNYHEKTAPLVEWYRARGKAVTIPADRSIDEVFARIQDALEQSGLVPA
jgi:adenylate kinase